MIKQDDPSVLELHGDKLRGNLVYDINMNKDVESGKPSSDQPIHQFQEQKCVHLTHRKVFHHILSIFAVNIVVEESYHICSKSKQLLGLNTEQDNEQVHG